MNYHQSLKSPQSPWFIWSIAEFFTLFQFMIQLTGGIIVAPLMIDFSITAFQAAIIISGFYYMYISLQIPVGIMMDKIGPRRLLSFGALICGLGCILFSQTHYFYLALFSRLCMGTGAAFAFVGTLYLIREWFPIERYAFLVGMSEMLGMLWAICGTLVFTAFLYNFGWRLCMLGCGCFFLLSSVASFLFIIDHNSSRKTLLSTQGINITLWQRFMIVSRSPLAWKNGIYSGLMFSIVTVFVALWEPPFLQMNLHVSLSEAATIDTMAFVGIALGCPLYGYLSQRYQKRRPFLIFSGISSALLFSIILYAPHLSPLTMKILTLLIGMTCSGYILSFAISDEISRDKLKNTYTGFTNAVCMLTAPLLQPIVGYILDLGLVQHGHYTLLDYQHGLNVVLIALLCATLLAWFIPETFKIK